MFSTPNAGCLLFVVTTLFRFLFGKPIFNVRKNNHKHAR